MRVWRGKKKHDMVDDGCDVNDYDYRRDAHVEYTLVPLASATKSVADMAISATLRTPETKSRGCSEQTPRAFQNGVGRAHMGNAPPLCASVDADFLILSFTPWTRHCTLHPAPLSSVSFCFPRLSGRQSGSACAGCRK
jgi:hypothetical protein